jgi:hypothetical protein
VFLAASTASAIFGGQKMQLLGIVQGPTARLWVATQGGLGGAANITAGHANIGQIAGHPAYAIHLTFDNSPELDDVSYSALVGSAPDAQPREWFKFESFPQGRAIRGATTFEQDMVGALRGNFPRLPAVGSPAPSGAAYVTVLAGSVDDFLGNDITDVELYATERFDFLR